MGPQWLINGPLWKTLSTVKSEKVVIILCFDHLHWASCKLQLLESCLLAQIWRALAIINGPHAITKVVVGSRS